MVLQLARDYRKVTDSESYVFPVENPNVGSAMWTVPRVNSDCFQTELKQASFLLFFFFGHTEKETGRPMALDHMWCATCWHVDGSEWRRNDMRTTHREAKKGLPLNGLRIHSSNTLVEAHSSCTSFLFLGSHTRLLVDCIQGHMFVSATAISPARANSSVIAKLVEDLTALGALKVLFKNRGAETMLENRAGDVLDPSRRKETEVSPASDPMTLGARWQSKEIGSPWVPRWSRILSVWTLFGSGRRSSPPFSLDAWAQSHLSGPTTWRILLKQLTRPICIRSALRKLLTQRIVQTWWLIRHHTKQKRRRSRAMAGDWRRSYLTVRDVWQKCLGDSVNVTDEVVIETEVNDIHRTIEDVDKIWRKESRRQRAALFNVSTALQWASSYVIAN